jgi:hypothetical protein
MSPGGHQEKIKNNRIMKKTLFALIALAVATVGCNKVEVINTTPDNLIGFNSPFVENATKVAADPTYGEVALTQFNVYGTVTGTAGTVNIFDGVSVTGTVGATEWSYAEQFNQYWIPGADYDFIGIVDADAVDQNTLKMPTSITYNTAGQKDLLYATAHVEDAAATQAAVNMSFSHLLSKAHFTVTSNTAGGYYHSVTGIKVSNFATGTYTINGGTWAGTAAADIAFGDVTEVTTASGAKTNATQMLLVPNADTFNVTFTVELYKNDTKLGTETKTISVNTDLVKGNAYNFTIACSVGNPIKFTVTNDPDWTGWTTQPDVTIQ